MTEKKKNIGKSEEQHILNNGDKMNKHDELISLSAGLLLYADLFASLESKIGSTNTQLSAIFEAAGNFMCQASITVENILKNQPNMQ